MGVNPHYILYIYRFDRIKCTFGANETVCAEQNNVSELCLCIGQPAYGVDGRIWENEMHQNHKRSHVQNLTSYQQSNYSRQGMIHWIGFKLAYGLRGFCLKACQQVM